MLNLATITSGLIGLTFTDRQKKALRNRDLMFEISGNKGGCQFPLPHSCNGNRRKEEHHILPQGYCSRLGIDPDYAENGITVCSHAHDIIHPDRIKARQSYHQDKNSFKELHQERGKLMDERKIYWNDEFDRQLEARAVYNTQHAKRKGWFFPPKRRKAA